MKGSAAYLLAGFLYSGSLAAQEADLVLPVGHTAAINFVLLTDDNSLAFTASDDKTISIWQTNTKQEIRKLKGAEVPITNAAITAANGRYAAAGGSDGKCLLWNAQNGKILKILPHEFPISALSFHGAGRLLSVATYSAETGNTKITLWETSGGTIVEEYDIDGDKVEQFAADATNDMLLAYMKSVRIAQLKHGSISFETINKIHAEQRIKGPYNGENLLVYSPSSLHVLKRISKQEIGIYKPPQGSSIMDAVYSSSSRIVYILLSNSKLVQYNPAKALVTAEFRTPKGFFSKIELSADEQTAYFFGVDNRVVLFDLALNSFAGTLSGKTIPLIDWDLGGKKIAGLYADSTLRMWRIKDRILLETLSKLKHMSIRGIGVMNDEDIFISAENEFIVYNTNKSSFQYETMNFMAKWHGMESGIIYQGSDSLIKLRQTDGQISTYGKIDVTENTKFRPYQNGIYSLSGSSIFKFEKVKKEGKFILMSIESISDFDTDEKGKYLALAIGNEVSVYFNDTFALKINAGNITGKNSGITQLRLSPSGKMLAIACTDHLIRLFNVANGKVIQNYYGHAERITRLQFSDDETYLYSSSMDHTLKCWAINADKRKALRLSYLVGDSYSSLVFTKYDTTLWADNPDGPTLYENATLMATGPDDWIVFTPERYYYCNKEAARDLGFNKNGKFFPFDQFDLKYNRPDIVLKSIGINDINLIHAFENAYSKRLNNAGLTVSSLSSEFSLPDVTIVRQDSLPVRTSHKQLNLDLRIKDQRFPIKRLMVYVNGVSVYGKRGIDVSSQNSRNISYPLSVLLSSGDNLIQVSAINNQGAESIKATHSIHFEVQPASKPSLYLIAISVSEYDDKSMNLQYAVKDGRDVVKAFASQKRFERVYVDSLFNGAAKADKLPEMKRKLLQSKVDDEVILFVSGHGLLDDSCNFYFASSDVDFKNPALRGISFEALEGLLDSIPARKKLMLIDACHSGELDPEEKLKAGNSNFASAGVVEISSRGIKILEEDSKVGLQNSFELMQELFSGLNKGSGTTVISAAAGKGYAYESKKWNNGVFTYAILSGMTEGRADANKNGTVNNHELLRFVSSEVNKLTNGAQKPTSRRENNLLSWTIWQMP